MGVEVHTDSTGNRYVHIKNIRLTYVPAERRADSKSWAGKDVIRIQSYRQEQGGQLFMGAEYPVDGAGDVVRLIETICALSNREVR